MNTGKEVRLQRIRNRETGKTVIIPMDHGFSLGPIEGLVNLPETVDAVARGGANAVVLHKGMVKYGLRTGDNKFSSKDLGLIVHLYGGNSSKESVFPNRKVPVATVQEASDMGADAVSVHVNVYSDSEPEQFENTGIISRECEQRGMPLLAMMYARGPNIKDESKYECVAHAVRIGAELGADIIKTNYTGDPKSFREVVEGCPAPVIMAGGSKKSDKEFLKEVYEAVNKSGAAGVIPGRNVFQREDKTSMVRAICGIVHEDMTVNQVMKKYMK